MNRRIALVLLLASLVAVIALALSGVLIQQRPLASPEPTLGPSAPATSPTVRCLAEPGPLPSMLASDPCPDAVFAIGLVVAPVRLPTASIVIQPGPFYCDVIWPGAGTPRPCQGVAVLPGQFMHAWVSFVGSDKVAAVMLGLDLPGELGQPGATRPPWHATLVATEIPPAGWVMP